MVKESEMEEAKFSKRKGKNSERFWNYYGNKPRPINQVLMPIILMPLSHYCLNCQLHEILEEHHSEVGVPEE